MQELASSATSGIYLPCIFGRLVGAAEDVGGVYVHEKHLIVLPQEREVAQRSAMAALKVRLEKQARRHGAKQRPQDTSPVAVNYVGFGTRHAMWKLLPLKPSGRC